MRRTACNRLPSLRRTLVPQLRVPTYIDTALVKPRSDLSPNETIKRMADDMRQAGYREGGITEGDLEQLGFTRGQIKTYGADARALAQRLAGASL